MSYTALTEKVCKARKPHSCEWCAERIELGEAYAYRSYIFEREFQQGHMHLECLEASKRVAREVVEEGWAPGDFPRGGTLHREDLMESTL